VFGVSVQEGSRQAVRLAASANYDLNVDDNAVFGRLVAASSPALVGCQNGTPVTAWPVNRTCNGGTWTFTLSIVNAGTTYSTLAAARTAAALAGANVTATAVGSVALVPGLQTGGFGVILPQISVQGQAAMVIL
jgi:hypothetical protein